jgi:MarR family transcriptional regulator, organic hydroperoxide resistance regulator
MYKQININFATEMTKCNSKYCTCLYFSANALARAITRVAEGKFSLTGLSPSHAFLVMTVNDKPGIQPKEISEMMQLTASTVTRLIDKMEQKGLLARNNLGKNIEIWPTDSGTALNAQIKAAWMGLYETYTSILGKEEAQNLTAEIYNSATKLES